ncbi:MAG: MurT ligase domain-containing protein [Dehalococcoidia bacterium]
MRRLAAITAGKAAAALSRGFGFGGGTALPGLVAESIEPGIVADLAGGLGQGSALITGTNGKTTTARLLGRMAQAQGYLPVANRAGSNLMRGIAAALVEASDLQGRVADGPASLGLFEVDEATLPEADGALRPRAVAFTNLFRDQLDRYGEVERVASVWWTAVQRLPSDTALVLNADDPAVARLAEAARGPLFLYGLADRAAGVGALEHAADARWCAGCGAELRYEVVYYGHLGRWACPQCGRARPQAMVEATRVEATAEGLSLTVALPDEGMSVVLPIVGLYNAYNAVAAVAAALALGIGPQAMESGLASFTAAFGRQERLAVVGRQVQVILAKNPAGLNQVLRTIAADGAPKDLALFLNDNIADGRDVSWIWDVDFEMLSGRVRSLVVSGSRAWDMALRLKYGGVASDPLVLADPTQALRQGLRQTAEGDTLYVIPTYTAMLSVRETLARWGRRAPFWEE